MMETSTYLDFPVENEHCYKHKEAVSFRVNEQYYRIKGTEKGIKLYNGGRVIAVLEDGKKYTRKEFDAIIVANQSKEIEKVIAKDPFIGALYEEILKKYPNAYVKYGGKRKGYLHEFPNLVAVPFVFTTIYVGAELCKYIMKFDSPEIGKSHIISDLNNSNSDPIKTTMKVLHYFQKAEDLIKKD